MVLDRSKDLDGLAVCLVGQREVATGVGGGGGDASVACERRTLAAAIDRFARRVHIPVLELDRGERLHDGELDSRIRNALEQSERALIVSDRTVELAGVV